MYRGGFPPLLDSSCWMIAFFNVELTCIAIPASRRQDLSLDVCLPMQMFDVLWELQPLLQPMTTSMWGEKHCVSRRRDPWRFYLWLFPWLQVKGCFSAGAIWSWRFRAEWETFDQPGEREIERETPVLEEAPNSSWDYGEGSLRFPDVFNPSHWEDQEPSLLGSGVQFLRVLCLPGFAKTSVAHHQEAGRILSVDWARNPSSLPERHVPGNSLLRANQGESGADLGSGLLFPNYSTLVFITLLTRRPVCDLLMPVRK